MRLSYCLEAWNFKIIWCIVIVDKTVVEQKQKRELDNTLPRDSVYRST